MSEDDGEKLLIRAKEIYDCAIPSGNSVMALNLLRVYKITGHEEYLISAKNLFCAFSGFLKKALQVQKFYSMLWTLLWHRQKKLLQPASLIQ